MTINRPKGSARPPDGAAAQEPPPALKITGAVKHPLDFTIDALAALPPEFHVDDGGDWTPAMAGASGVRMSALLALARPAGRATHVVLRSSGGDDPYAICLPIAVATAGLVVFRGENLSGRRRGGPLRFVLPAPASGDAVRRCPHVKHLGVIEVATAEIADLVPEAVRARRRMAERIGRARCEDRKKTT